MREVNCLAWEALRAQLGLEGMHEMQVRKHAWNVCDMTLSMTIRKHNPKFTLDNGTTLAPTW